MTRSEIRFLGVDGEMSGIHETDGDKLIQIGVAVDTAPDGTRLAAPDLFCSLIGWPDEDLSWNEASAAVHHIPREVVLAAPPANAVDDQLYEWLVDHGCNEDRRHDTVAVGINVGVFDFPYIRTALPRTASLFSRRYADLNPVLFALGGSIPVPGGPISPVSWKRHLRHVGLRRVRESGRAEGEHDAGTDALLALEIWREVGDLLAGLHRDASAHRAAARSARKAAARGPDD